MNYNINFLLKIIISKYFDCLFCICDNCNLKITNAPVIIFRVNTTEDVNHIKYVETNICHNFLIVTKNPAALVRTFEEHIKRYSDGRYNNRRYLIVTNRLEGNWSFLTYLKNVLFILDDQTNENRYEFYTHRYVGGKDNNEFILIDVWFARSNTFLYNADWYPNKELNQYGRLLKVGVVDYSPYCATDLNLGSELMLILEYGKRYNFTIEIGSELEWGTMYSNWTGEGLLGKVIMDVYDIGLGALFPLPFRIKFADFSSSTALSQVTCLVPVPKIISSWLILLKIFNPSLWVIIIFFIVLVIATAHLISQAKLNVKVIALRRGHKKRIRTRRNDFKSLLIAYTLVTQSAPRSYLPQRGTNRCYLISVLLLSFIISVLFSSSFSSLLTIPRYENAINTLEEFASSKLKWGERAIDWALPLETYESGLPRRVFEQFEVKTDDELRELSLTFKYAFGIERLPSGVHAIGEFIKEDVIDKYTVMKKNLYAQYTAFELRKNSVLLRSLNFFVLRSTEAGLLMYWESMTTIKKANIKVQMGVLINYQYITVEKLKFEQVKGPFMILAFGLLTSLFIFIYEIIKYKYKI